LSHAATAATWFLHVSLFMESVTDVYAMRCIMESVCILCTFGEPYQEDADPHLPEPVWRDCKAYITAVGECYSNAGNLNSYVKKTLRIVASLLGIVGDS